MYDYIQYEVNIQSQGIDNPKLIQTFVKMNVSKANVHIKINA